MKKAGGILGLIGGVFGVFAAIVTLFFGGFASAFHASGAATVVGLGWGGLGFSFLAIILGAVCLGAESRWPAGLLIASSILGGVLGGTLVAICMILGFVGGVLAWAGTQPAPGRGKGRPWAIAGGVSLALIAVLMVIGDRSRGSSAPAAKEPKPVAAQVPATPPQFHVGETFQGPSFRITVSSAKVTDAVGDGLFRDTPAAGGEFLAVAWNYTNISKAPVESYQAPSLALVDPAGHVYSSDLEASSAFASQVNADAKLLSNVNPGITIADGDVFEVSKMLFDPRTWKLRVTSGDGSAYVVLAAAPAASSAVAQAASTPGSAPAPASPAIAEGEEVVVPGTIRIGHDKLAGGTYTYVHADSPFTSPCDQTQVRDVLLWNPTIGDPQILKAFAGQHVLLHGQFDCPGSGIQFSPDSSTHP